VHICPLSRLVRLHRFVWWLRSDTFRAALQVARAEAARLHCALKEARTAAALSASEAMDAAAALASVEEESSTQSAAAEAATQVHPSTRAGLTLNPRHYHRCRSTATTAYLLPPLAIQL